MASREESDGSRQALSETTLHDLSNSSLWGFFSAIEHEVVRSNEVCSVCSDSMFENGLLPGAHLPNKTNEILTQRFSDIINRSGYCWFCRFQCRIVARSSSQEDFTRCVNEDFQVNVLMDYGGWEAQLLLPVDNTAPALSYQVIVNWPLDDCEWRTFPDLTGLRLYSSITCHNLTYPPSRRFRKLVSDSVTQRREFFREINRWLLLCESWHLICCRPVASSLPLYDGFRVIDVSDRTFCRPTVECRYVALSYVWGEKPFLRACTEDEGAPNLSALLQQINTDSPLPQILPQTIEDAISITESLGQRYLWVDLLCIDQHNSLVKNKAISEMDKIYSGAFLTICVLDGSSMFSGIPGVNTPLAGRCQVITDTETDRYIFTRSYGMEEVFENSDWVKRAWTFQEGELSRRRLCFSHEGVFLICKEEIFHDFLELDESETRVKGPFDTGGMFNLALGFDLDIERWSFDTYARMVASFSCRSMTFSSDAHNAIAGAIRKMTENLNINFVAALPVDDLCNALLWLSPHDSYGIRADPKEGRRRRGFPSWSWLGWEGPIEYWFWLQESRYPHAKEECIFSLVDRMADVLEHDAVKVLASALIIFESISPDFSNAVLQLATTTTRFRVTEVANPRGSEQQKDKRWILLNQNGQRINRGTSSSQDQEHWNSAHEDETLKSCCSFCLHSTSSAELTRTNTKELDFVLVQHWASNVSEAIPESFLQDVTEEELPRRNRVFEGTIWALAILRQPDGLYERLTLVSIPAKAWFAADPQLTVVRMS